MNRNSQIYKDKDQDQNQNKYYQCSVSDNWIRFMIVGENKDIADMRYFNLDMPNIKLWVKLLAEATNDLKNSGIKKIIQATTEIDFQQIKQKTTWEKIDEQSEYGIILMQCDIDSFLTNYAESMK